MEKELGNGLYTTGNDNGSYGFYLTIFLARSSLNLTGNVPIDPCIGDNVTDTVNQVALPSLFFNGIKQVMRTGKTLLVAMAITASSFLASCSSSGSGETLDTDETLLDVETGLTWVNDIRFCMAGVTRPENATCNILSDMAVGGINDWRLPTSAEMSEVTLAVDADENVTLNYINAACAVMTASDGWVFTENSTAPGEFSPIEPGNAGVRCVSGESI